jgi:hypothetical protein
MYSTYQVSIRTGLSVQNVSNYARDLKVGRKVGHRWWFKDKEVELIEKKIKNKSISIQTRRDYSEARIERDKLEYEISGLLYEFQRKHKVMIKCITTIVVKDPDEKYLKINEIMIKGAGRE